MSMEIDARGVVVAVYEGEFDATAWMRQRAAVFESRYRPEAYDGRPTVVDARRCRVPERDWSAHFEQVARQLGQRKPKPARHAIVIADEAGQSNAVALFAAYQRMFHHPHAEARAFRDYDAAYAWALEGLAERPPGPAGGVPAA